jgi:hypothetical protein
VRGDRIQNGDCSLQEEEMSWIERGWENSRHGIAGAPGNAMAGGDDGDDDERSRVRFPATSGVESAARSLVGTETSSWCIEVKAGRRRR